MAKLLLMCLVVLFALPGCSQAPKSNGYTSFPVPTVNTPDNSQAVSDLESRIDSLESDARNAKFDASLKASEAEAAAQKAKSDALMNSIGSKR